MMKPTSQFRIVGLAVLFVFATAICLNAAQVSAHFAGLGGQNQNGEYTYPYFITIDNSAEIPMICDDFYHQSGIGDTWQANLTPLAGGDLSNTRFGVMAEYQEAGYLLMQISEDNEPEWGNINFAIWQIFNPSVNAGDAPPGTLGAAYWLNLAQTADLSAVDFSGIFILTPLDAQAETGDQEFMFLTPEPGTLLLVGGTMIGLFSQRRRFL